VSPQAEGRPISYREAEGSPVSPQAEGRPISYREAEGSPVSIAADIKAAAHGLGFDLVAIGPAGRPDHAAAFEDWLAAGHLGTMSYLERGREKRVNPDRVLPGARSVVTCALSYYQGPAADGPAGVARYAWGDDYHSVLETRLRILADTIARLAPGSAARAYVDTGPLLERDLAARAGLGWIGKNTMLLHPELGSFFFIGTVLTTAGLEPDAPLADRCGTCTRCLDACPTDAFVAPYVLDARRCIAYLTIEHRGPIPSELRPGVGTWVFGCDVCQDVCPWNRRAAVTRDGPAFDAREHPSHVELLTLDEAAYRDRFRGSPLKRARREGLARNAAVALGNRGQADAVSAVVPALSHADPTVRGHAAWALGRLGGAGAGTALRSARVREADAGVRQEIEHALGQAVGRPAQGEEPS
jgi:epoxyqueuosine reductase